MEPEIKKHHGISHLGYALMYSMAGFRAMLHETAFQHEVIFGLLAVPAAWLIPNLSILLRLTLTLLWISLIAAELINTAIEAVVDMVMPQRHPLAKKAKDLGSAVVFCAIAANALSWIIVICQLV